MQRKTIYDKLSSICTVKQLSNRSGAITEPTIILMKKPAMASVQNFRGVVELWEVLCYVPDTSVVALDELQRKVINALNELGVRITGTLGADFYDPDLKAYMTTVEFRTPRVIS